MRDNPYTVLSVSRDASDADVRSAYKRQALITHPDKGGTAEAFRKVVEAFETLGDVGRRAAYERAEHSNDSASHPRRAAQTAGRCVPRGSAGARGGNNNQRPHAGAGKRPNVASSATTKGRGREDGTGSVFPNRCPEAASAKNTSEGSTPAFSRQETRGNAATNKSEGIPLEKPISVTRLIEELLHLAAAALTKRLDELSDTTLAEIEVFLRGADGRCGCDLPRDGYDVCGGNAKAEKEPKQKWSVCAKEADEEADGDDYDVGSDQENSGTTEDESSSGEEAATLALKWWGEDDMIGGLSDSDTEFVPCCAAMGPSPTGPVATGALDAAAAGSSCDGAATLAVGNVITQHGDVGDDGTTAAPVPPSSQSSTRVRTLMRGVIKAHGKFLANVGIENMMLISSACPDLDTAIDVHITMVRMRQIIIAKMQEGSGFPDALREVVALVMAERRQYQTFDFRLHYRIQVRSKNCGKETLVAKRTSNIDEAIPWWNDMIGAVRQKRLERRRLLAEVAEEQRRKRVERRQRALHRRMEREQRVKAREQRAKAREQRAEARLRVRTRLLLARVRCLMVGRVRRSEQALLRRWGVRVLPKGVESASLHQNDDSLCAVIRLSDGSLRRGPPRPSPREAETDAVELSALQSRRGDAAVCAELERRDVAAMTVYFLEFVGQPAL
eukprot:TRINITY_DN10064_c0_g1_i5.p1 TRINITY_DN10064_c0_g1~~TRINITY_DN10064_c0_g1_i5.p1  ORF type:complete len:672 (-),score=111.15 TRINITY_DN10064_c0_g1_i5:49-2064(-)